MKKLLILFLVATMFVGTMSGCKNPSKNSDKIQIVTTIFPVYDWVKNIVGDDKNIEVTMLMDNGADLHSFQPTAEDILTISGCDMFVYVGGESDEWVDDALEEKSNDKMEVVSLMDKLGDNASQEEVKEGMQDDEDCDEDKDGDDSKEKADADDREESADEEVEYDEHIWLSLKNAQILCDEITEKLKKIDKKHSDVFDKNNKAYQAKLNKLDIEYKKMVDNAKVKTIVVADRFPFLYMTKDYGIDYFAAFKGCSAETEASFETIKFLANKVDELKLKNILVIEGTNHKIADTVARATKTKKKNILVLDSMQSITGEDAKAGEKYIKVMEENKEVLQKALSN